MRQRAKVQAEEMTESKRVKKVSLVAGEEKYQEVSTVERRWAARRQKIWNGTGPGSGARQAFLTAGFHAFSHSLEKQLLCTYVPFPLWDYFSSLPLGFLI